MSDCGVCIYVSDCDSETIGFQCKTVRASRDWECCECGERIPKHTAYELASGFRADNGNSHWQSKTCVLCAEIANAFMCDGRWYGSGRFWEQMEESFASLNSSCFDRLKSAEAKTELRRRWMEWKGLTA